MNENGRITQCVQAVPPAVPVDPAFPFRADAVALHPERLDRHTVPRPDIP